MVTLSYPHEVKAKIDHKCDFCGYNIIPEEMYIKSTHIFDGMIYDWKTHKYCSKIAHDLKMYDDCDEGVTHENFVEIVSEEFFTLLTDGIPKEDQIRYKDIIRFIPYVQFRRKLFYVIQHHNRLTNKPDSE